MVSKMKKISWRNLVKSAYIYGILILFIVIFTIVNEKFIMWPSIVNIIRTAAPSVLVGVAVTTHSETPGLGSRAKDDPSFAGQFKGLPIKDPFSVKPDGGQIDAVSGATVTSRGVCGAVSASSAVYFRLKDEVVKKL